jgi:RNA recognition motif-containing protein
MSTAGKLNGFGHIQFAEAEAVQRALALHGADLMGREIFVDAASNRPGPAPLPAGRPVDGCWFCLSNPNADVELVASVGEAPSS